MLQTLILIPRVELREMDFCCKNSPTGADNSVGSDSGTGSLQTGGVYHYLWICWSGCWPELLRGVRCMERL